MARYRSSVDLGAFIGTRLISVPNEKGQTVTGIFIPTGINGIEVRQDTRDEKNRNGSKLRAFLNFMQRSYSSAFLSRCRDNIVSKGETPNAYNVPAWQQCYLLPEEKRTAIRAALKKAVLAEHPEWQGQEDTKGTDLSAAISRMMPFQVGDCYLIEEQTGQQQQTYSNAPSAQQVAGYTPVEIPSTEQPWQAPDDDALPF